MEAVAQSLTRIFGDGADRGRLNSDSTVQKATPPRCIAIVSGEDTPGVGESGLARFYICDVAKTDIPANDELTTMQELARAGYLQRAMRGYITWLLEQIDGLPDSLHDEFIRNRSIAAQRASAQQHGRSPEALAHIMLGYNTMLRYMRDVGAISREDCETYSAEAWDILTASSKKQAEEMRSDRPTEIFLSTLRELLASKAVTVRNMSAPSGGNPPTTPPREMIGYMDSDYYYLLPKLAYRAVAKMCNDQGQAFPLTLKMLYKQMREDGILPFGESGEPTRVKWIDGRAQRPIWIPRALLDGPKVSQQQMCMDDMTVNGFVPADDPDVPFEDQ